MSLATEEFPQRGLGDNNPPVDLKADLLERHAKLLAEAQELLAAGEKAPKEITDEATQGKAMDLQKKMRACELAIDAEWEKEQKPFDDSIGIIKGTFDTPVKALEKLRKEIKEATTAFSVRKEAERKRALAEEEERLRQLAAEKLRKAQDAEQKKNDAVKAASDFELLANQARIARAAASTEIEVAEAKVTTAKAAIGKAKADMLQAAADFAARVRDGNPATEDEKALKRAEFEKAKAQGVADLEVAELELKTAKETASAARAKQLEAEELAREQARLAKTAARDQVAHLDDAVRDEKRADRIEAKADETGLGQSVSEHGAMTTLARVWECSITDVHKLDMAALWPHVSTDEKLIALRKWMLLQPVEKRSMAGAVMELVAVGQVR